MSEGVNLDILRLEIQVLLDKNGEVYITKRDVLGNRNIQRLLGGNHVDFIVKKNATGNRRKTLILVVGEIESEYDSLSFFCEPYVITAGNYQQQLLHIFPLEDVYSLAKRVSGEVPVDEVVPVPVDEDKELFKLALSNFAANILDQAEI